jgi:hypothetical protein
MKHHEALLNVERHLVPHYSMPVYPDSFQRTLVYLLAQGVYLDYNLRRPGRVAQLVRALLSHSSVLSEVL